MMCVLKISEMNTVDKTMVDYCEKSFVSENGPTILFSARLYKINVLEMKQLKYSV